MTITYDPRDPAYFDERDLREELTRVYDLCHGCRMCFNLCPSFPTLFDYADKYNGEVSKMTPEEQDHVVDECYGCKLCYVKCPYIPPHEWDLDFPRLMMRAEAVLHRNGSKMSTTDRMSKLAMNRPDAVGKLATRVAPMVNKVVTQNPGGAVRKVMEKVSGIASERLLPPFSKQRFTTWFKKRLVAPLSPDRRRGRAAIYPTCFVEYMEPQIGRDMVAVYERNGIECTLAGTTACCGAPMLHGGDVDGFTKQARANVAALAESVRAGKDVVVPQPTCGYVLKKDYPLYAPGPEAELVAKHTYDAAEYLMKVHRDDKAAGGAGIDVEFAGEVPPSVAYHVPCHLQAQNAGLKSRDLMKLTGTKITLVQKCSGIDGTWGYRAPNYELSRKVAAPLVEALEKASADAPGEIVGDCHLANGAIVQETGMRPMHPLSFLARAYGITEEEDRRWGTPS